MDSSKENSSMPTDNRAQEFMACPAPFLIPVIPSNQVNFGYYFYQNTPTPMAYQLVPVPIMNVPHDLDQTQTPVLNKQKESDIPLDEALIKNEKVKSKEEIINPNSTPNNNMILQPDKAAERWKREDDKKLYRFVSNYCIQSGDTLDSIYRRLKQNHKKEFKLWRSISNEIKWKGPIRKAQNRFIMLSNLHGISTREIELLRKLAAKKKSDPSADWDSILYHFPGRSIRDVEVGLRKIGLDENIISNRPLAVSRAIVEEFEGTKSLSITSSSKSQLKSDNDVNDESVLIRIDLSVIDVDEEDEDY